MSDRIGTQFHETFALDISRLAKVVQALGMPEAAQIGRSQSRFDFLRERTGLGKNMVKAFPRYARGCGLLNADDTLTALGRRCSDNPNLLTDSRTQWLMHYHLSAPHGPGPQFWSDVVLALFRPGSYFARDQLDRTLSDSVARQGGKVKDVSATATAFLGSYTKEAGLSRLGILRESGGQEVKHYEVHVPEPPPPAALAYALVDYWQGVYGERRSINLDDLTAAGGFADLFLTGTETINEMVRFLHASGYADVYRVAQPYQLVLLRTDPAPLLEQIYGPADPH